MRDLKEAIKHIEKNSKEIERLENEAEKIAKEIEPQLIGRRVKRGSGKLEGDYEISRITTSYRGTLRAYGYKIVKGGKRGSQQWDIGWISFNRLLPPAPPEDRG